MPMQRPAWLSRVSKVSGLATVAASSRDAKILFLQRFVRLFAYGATFIILVHFLSGLGISDARVGLFMTMTMLGDVLVSLLLTLVTDRVGRRRVLGAGAALMAASGVVFALSSGYWVLLGASVLGVISPSGNEIGPFRAVEESILAQLTDEDDRSDVFVWYTMSGTAGAALGTMASGWLIQALRGLPGWNDTKAYRVLFALYATAGVLKLFLTVILSENVELEQTRPAYHEVIELEDEDEDLLSESSSSRRDSLGEEEEQAPKKNNVHRKTPTDRARNPQNPSVLERLRSLLPPISPSSLSILFRLIFLFAMDSFASGLASPSWLTYFFTVHHDIPPSSLGFIFFTTNILATLSNFAALPMARRLGPLKTMTFTHFPSAVFLGLIPFPPTTAAGSGTAIVLLWLRACTQSMDQAPRQAFLAAAVRNEERTAVLGVVNIVKTLAQAAGIGSSGVLAQKRLWVVMLGGAGLMKGSYDLLILWTFLKVKGAS